MTAGIDKMVQNNITDASYVTSALTVVAGLTINEWVALGGLCLAAATFAVNWYYKHKTFKRNQGK